ncbi:MAG: hypothetical protein AB7K24_32125 [Gemmataceae bacterium]
MTSLRRTAMLALTLLLVSVGALRAADEIKVVVIAVLASEDSKEVDPKLKCIADKVQKVEPKLTGFRLARTTTRMVAVGRSDKFPLVDDEVVTVTLDRPADEQNRVSVTVKPPNLGAIAYTSCCGKFFPIVTRYQTKKKERLIIAIMVETCNE